MTRGEIWLVDFGVPIGSEAGYRRPAVVLEKKIKALPATALNEQDKAPVPLAGHPIGKLGGLTL